jgi:hypothetical protein
MSITVSSPPVFTEEVQQWLYRNPLPADLISYLDTHFYAHAHTVVQTDVFADALQECQRGNTSLHRVLLLMRAAEVIQSAGVSF